MARPYRLAVLYTTLGVLAGVIALGLILTMIGR